jgi:hypothetical protein
MSRDAVSDEQSPDIAIAQSGTDPSCPVTTTSQTTIVPLERNSTSDAAITTYTPSKPRESAWTCRLPKELMTIIFEFIIESDWIDRGRFVIGSEWADVQALARLQATSSAMYTLVTPFLYRSINLDQDTAKKLFSLFESVAPSDYRLFAQTVPLNIHPIDLPLPHRLHSHFKHTRDLSLFLDDYDYSLLTLSNFSSYIKVVHGLEFMGGATLWPMMKRLVLKIQDLWTGRAYPAAGMLFSCIPTKYLLIELPEVLVEEVDGDNFGYEDWVEIVSKMSAEHVEIINYQLDFRWIPSASSSITLRFLADCHSFDDSLYGSIGDIREVDEIKLYRCSDQIIGEIDACLRREMQERALYRINRDLTIGISREGHEEETGIEWRVYRAKDFVESDENLVESDEDLVESDDGECLSCQIFGHSRY